MGPQVLKYGDETIEYTICLRPEMSGKVSMHVYPDGTVVVDAPQNETPEKIRSAVRKRARWLSGHIRKIRRRQSNLVPRRYVSGESHLYLGRRYMLKVIRLSAAERRGGTQPSVKMIGGQLRVQSPNRDSTVVKKLLSEWYREHARNHFQRRLDELKLLTPWVKGRPLPIRLFTMKKHWGSCSPSGKIILNPHLVKAPYHCIDYVILHELCHMKEHNHSQQFWRLMERVMPKWHTHKTRLDELADQMLNV